VGAVLLEISTKDHSINYLFYIKIFMIGRIFVFEKKEKLCIYYSETTNFEKMTADGEK
jgi:hypothetical protein